jgi:hypothetical protein
MCALPSGTVSAEHESGDIAGRICENGELRAARHLSWRKVSLAAKFLRFVQRFL